MPQTRDIRRRIKSVRSTAQITRAMQMVASSRMHKAQQAALAGRPYASLLRQMLSRAVHFAAPSTTSPLLTRPSGDRCLVLVVGPDKGLCGALVANILRESLKYDRDAVRYIAVGRKAASFLYRMRREVVAEFSYGDPPQFKEGRAISRYIREQFLAGRASRVEVIFASYVSPLVQRIENAVLLPVTDRTLEAREAFAQLHRETGAVPDHEGSTVGVSEFAFEPSAEHVLDALIPHALDFRIHQILLEVRASEHSARMAAMRSATDNARQLLRELTLELNQLRQAGITQEILELSSSGASAA